MSKTLVVYYSRKGENYMPGGIQSLEKGHTAYAAEYIAKAALFGDDGYALGNVVFGSVEAAVAAGKQQSVRFFPQQGKVLFKIFHRSTLLFLAAEIKGSSATWRSFSQIL